MKITIRLRPGRDNDIEQWYNSLPSGDRSRVIRNILKDYITYSEVDNKNVSSDGLRDIKSKQDKINFYIKRSRKKYSKENINENIEFKLDDLLEISSRLAH